MSYHLVIEGGTIVDGTGAAPFRGDVAIKDGRVAAVGKVEGEAKAVIDASGLIVAPGFFDPHTHYDAQLCWDPMVTPSSWHGVTTVVMGNCGVGIAPCRPEARDIATWDLVNVEGIPFDVLKEGIKWDWVTFPEFMDAASRRPSAINMGFLAPLSAFRHFVMGEESIEREATGKETGEIKELLKKAIVAGALGFSSSQVPNHIGFKGMPLASRLASTNEFKEYARGLKEIDKGVIEIMLTKSLGNLDDDEYQMIDLLLDESGRKVTWGAIVKRYDDPDSYVRAMRKAQPLIDKGGIPQVASHRIESQLNLHAPFDLGSSPTWKVVFNKTKEEQKKIYGDPSFRQKYRDELKSPPPGTIFFGNWDLVGVKSVSNPALQSIEQSTVAEIAAQRGADPLDTFFDLAIEDDLEIVYGYAIFDVSGDLINREGTLISLSDGGAHVTMLCDAGYCTNFIAMWVREQGVISLEAGIKRLTSEPADFFGLHDRGRLLPEMAADIVIFDYDSIGPAKMTAQHDLPGGARRLVTTSHGIKHTIVNGLPVYSDGKATGQLPGQVLRSS